MRVWFRLKDGRTLSGEYNTLIEAWSRVRVAEKNDNLQAWGLDAINKELTNGMSGRRLR